MEPSWKSHAIVYFYGVARRRNWKCGYTQLEAATFNHVHAQLQPLGSVALALEITTPSSGMKAQVSLQTTIEPHDLAN